MFQEDYLYYRIILKIDPETNISFKSYQKVATAFVKTLLTDDIDLVRNYYEYQFSYFTTSLHLYICAYIIYIYFY